MVDFVSSTNGLFATAAIRCINGKQTERLEDDLYANQKRWMHAEPDITKKEITRFASLSGMDKSKLDACFSNLEMQEKMLDSRRRLVSLYNINSTPTLLVRKGSKVYTLVGSNKKEIEKELDEIFQE